MTRIFLASRLFVLGMTCLNGAVAQDNSMRSLSAADYARAEKMMGYNTSQLIDRSNINPNWLPGDKFWYRVLTASGSEFVIADPMKSSRSPAFDHQKLASALSAAAGTKVNAEHLPFQQINYNVDESFSFQAFQKDWTYNPSSNLLNAAGMSVRGGSENAGGLNEVISPDGRRVVFIREYNLWMRDIATSKEVQLTTDGMKDFGYATDNAGWTKSDRPLVEWSPDSKKLATFQQDQREISDMYLVTTNVGAPKLEAWKYPLPGDKDVISIYRVIIDVEKPAVIRLKIPPGPRRGTQCDDLSCCGKDFGDVEWNRDGSKLAFVTTNRDHKRTAFWIAEAATGNIRAVFQENVATQFESGQGTVNWHFLDETNEIVWFSERDNWGHLYLYDANTGKLKNQITKGEWAISQLLKVDEKKRLLYFLAGGREPGRNPYFDHLYQVSFDGKKLALLTPEDGNHQITLSPGGRYFIDRFSKQDIPPTMVLRNMEGKLLVNLEKADISRLTATGWKPPTPIVLKSRDGKFDLYGLMFKPTILDSSKKYPIVNYIYPGPQRGSISSWSFEAAVRDNQSLAELGFIVVAIEGTCNPWRSKNFHDMCYGNMADNTLPDQIAGIKQLAARYTYMDTSRVGIWGHSGGGFATAAAMFRFPEFYKVGISESGNHDNRNYEDEWGERYIGLVTMQEDGKSNYDAQANQNFAKNLRGKLLLAHGMMDDNVPPSNTMLVVDALIKANKDFDLVVFPNARHSYAEDGNYMTRRRWDYFTRYLMGAIPPHEYELKSKQDPRNM